MAETKKYASLESLQTFKTNADNLYATKVALDTKVNNDDVITNDEIDEICGGTLANYLDSIAAEGVAF